MEIERLQIEIVNPDNYRRAFLAYIRKGTPIHLSLKQGVPTTHYVWRTLGDDKVRPSHAANHGRLFSWANPPATGHPGEDYNCRCDWIPYIPGETEFAYHELLDELTDSPERWGDDDFFRHFFEGEGREVTLSDIGHLRAIVNQHAYYGGAESAFRQLSNQIADEARGQGSGQFSYVFDRSYDFRGVATSHGYAVVEGEFEGSVSSHRGYLEVDGSINFRFRDVFTDPFGIRDGLIGTSDPDAVSAFWRRLTDGGGTVYNITGQWRTRFRAEVALEREVSEYRVRKEN
ncbi:MAG: minor capsid protein [Proteobacteria bacterium]|nr:minor capsid protein [Pseudomonadota bacterium]